MKTCGNGGKGAATQAIPCTTKRVIPGGFYWALNEVADAWHEFRYPVLKKIPTGEIGKNKQPAYRYEPTGDSKRLGTGEFAVYHLICRWVDNTTRDCHRYLSAMCKRLEITHNTLKTYLRNLEGAKLLGVEWGRVDPETGAPAPTVFALLDVREALDYGRVLSGKLSPAAGDGEASAIDGGAEADDTGISQTESPRSATEQGVSTDDSRGCQPSTGGLSKIDANNRLSKASSSSASTKRLVQRDARDASVSPEEESLPEPARGEEGRRRFPRTIGLASWCRCKLGRPMFPVDMPAEGLEPFEEALDRLEGVTRACGQTAAEVITTRIWLRPEVQAQLREAAWPYAVIARQLNFALEDFSARAVRQKDYAPVAGRRRAREKPEWMSDEEWAFYEGQEKGHANA